MFYYFFVGRVAGYVTEKKKKIVIFEHKKLRNNSFQYTKNYF